MNSIFDEPKSHRGFTMKNPRSVVIAAGLNSLIKSYNAEDKNLCSKYIKENFSELPDLFDLLGDAVLLQIMKDHRLEIKEWAIKKSESK